MKIGISGKSLGQRKVDVDNKRKGRNIIDILKKAYLEPRIALNYNDPFQLYIAVVLSAQCTDKRVNIVTRDLFKKYNGPEDYLSIPQNELEKDIHSTGFYRNKAKNIRNACKMLIDNYKGRMPKSMEELLALPGIGRKSANCILGEAYNITSGIVVDTHVMRLSKRLGFTDRSDPVKIEQDLMKIIPKKHWIEFPNLLIYHGRSVCKARKPQCPECVLRKFCPSAEQFISAYNSSY